MQTIQINLNLSKIDKDRIVVGEKGKYINLTLFLHEDADKFGNHGALVHGSTKEEREKGYKSEFVGNAKINETQSFRPLTEEEKDELPF